MITAWQRIPMMDNDISCQRPNVITCTVGSSVVVVVVEMALVLMMSAVAVVLIVAFNGRLEFDWASSAIPKHEIGEK